ncbi:MAG TPA: glycoside hydrolase family 31 protein [Rhizomicrobium sp.]|nr:glycoside hydrolase family 31 protein [Rhizomicrobium sp.]
MSRSLANPPRFSLARRDGARIALSSDAGFAAHIFVLEPDIIRVALLRDGGGFSMPRTWAIAPGADDVAEEGRDRFDVSGFSCPSYELAEQDGSLVISTGRLRLTIALSGFHCSWDMATPQGWQRIARDRATQAYNFGWWGSKVCHYLKRNETERYYGLGERSGDMDRAGRRFRLSNTDAMGYSAKTSDPLYKHIPFYVTYDTASRAAFGLFYDTYADCVFDFGAEISNYHGPYRYFSADSGDLDYYVIAGPQIADVTRRFTWLTGTPPLMPKWSLGYSGSTMSYTDAPDAQAEMARFIEKCREHDILCDSFHLSSGYTSIGGKRHVFHWNREKFPDPAAFVRSYHDAGIRLCANIKPCLLAENPLFGEAREKGILVCDENGEPVWTQFWSGLGAYVDFTNPAARAWWKERVKDSLLAFGIDSTWNDNNEFEIVSPQAVALGLPVPATDAKPLQSLLMMKSSREAQRAFAPERRPFLVTRAGAAGMQRYAQTWSGDNSTAWDTLRYNIRMGLGLALSGVSNSGHDVGGFAGPAPDTELFVRWVEAGVFMPRFSIHSWNSDGTVNEPWMHADATAAVRALIALRYALLPYLYDLLWQYRGALDPLWRPLFYDFPDDPRAFNDTDSYLLGPSLLVTPVCEPGLRELEVTLPAGCGWMDFWSGARLPGGETVEAEARPGRPVLFVKENSAIAMNIAEQHFAARADERAFAVFAGAAGHIEAASREDDGESEAWRTETAAIWTLTVDCGETLSVSCRKNGSVPAETLTLLFRPSETRAVEARDGAILSDTIAGDWRRVVLRPKS